MTFIIGLLVALGILAVITLYSCLSWGFVCYKFWYWFIIPIFGESFNLPDLVFWQAVGLMFFIDLFKNHSPSELKDEYKKKAKDGPVLAALITPWILVTIGWFFKLS